MKRHRQFFKNLVRRRKIVIALLSVEGEYCDGWLLGIFNQMISQQRMGRSFSSFHYTDSLGRLPFAANLITVAQAERAPPFPQTTKPMTCGGVGRRAISRKRANSSLAGVARGHDGLPFAWRMMLRL